MRVLAVVLLVLIGCGKEPTGPELVYAPLTGEVTPIVAEALKEAKGEGRRLIVYVSASWCEPCKYFQDAVLRGQLNQELKGVRFLKFDRDLHEARLIKSGYSSRLIPLFVVPKENGEPSERRMEGSVKGEKALRENLVPRLLALLEK
jgi:thiol:disulfide interchange protein